MPALADRVHAFASTPDRLLWAVRVRWLVIAGFLSLALAAHAFGLFGSLTPCLQAAVVGSIVNGWNHWGVRRRRYVLPVTAVAIPFDHILTTYVVVNTGGVQSPFVMMYVVQVLATAMLVDTLIAAASAVLAILLWAAGISMLAAHYFTVPALLAGAPSSAMYQATWAAFLLYCLALLVYLGGYISDRLRSSEHDLAEKNRRLEEALASLQAAHDEVSAAYDRLRQTEAHLVQSEKMRSLGQLVAGVAHELNNPISFVSANVEHLRDYAERLEQALDAYANVPWPAEARAGLEAMRRELRIDQVRADLPSLLADCEEGARRTKRIVNDLRTFSRSERRETWRAADLHAGIESTLALLNHRLQERITVHRDFGDLPEVECLAGQLNQVFMNLLANAADAIGKRPGNIWISTKVSGREGTLQSPEPAVIIEIRDDGPGMAADVRSRIFEPFFTTKDVGQGTGLGLSISYAIVQSHGGSLRVESAPGAGATFTIVLPVRQAASGS